MHEVGLYDCMLNLFMTLCDPNDCSPAGFSVHGIFQARTPEWVAMPSSEDLPDPGIESASHVSAAMAGGFFTTVPPGKLSQYIVSQSVSSSVVFHNLFS